MLSKNEVKDIQSLRHKKFREERKVFVAEGPKVVPELLEAIPQQAEKVLATEAWAEANRRLLQRFPHQVISQQELEKISQLQTPNAVLAVFRQWESRAPETRKNFCLYLDAIQDPGNFGTIIRIADWFGIKDIVCTEGCADPYNSKVVQSTMASIARVNVFYDEGFQWLSAQKVPVYAAMLNGESLFGFERVEEGILMIGNESKGLRPDLIQRAERRITIPRKGAAESLNAAVATGIILSHLISL